MLVKENKAVVLRFGEVVQEFWRTGDAELLDSMLADGFVNHTPGVPPDREGFKQILPMYRAAFPDLEISLKDIIAEGNRVAIRVESRGTHRGELMGIPPTGNPITVGEMHIYRIEDGMIVERWGEFDRLGLMQQVGAIPSPEGRAQAQGLEVDRGPGSGPPGVETERTRDPVLEEENKAVVRSAVEAFNRGDWDAVDRLFAADYVDHDPSRAGLPPGPEGVKRAWGMFRAAFPDLQGALEDVIAEGDRVVVRGVVRGTHQGELMGIPPTGRQVTVTLIDINRIEGGKLVERWAVQDNLGMMQQLGVVPTPGEAGA